jgi:hypothetical protein
MSRVLPHLPVALMLLTSGTSAQNVTVDGTVNATWTSPNIVSPAQDALVHAGDTLTVTISGQVDTNQEQQSRRKCDLWVFCHDENYTIHHFVTAGDVGIVLQVRPKGGGDAIDTAIGLASPVTLRVRPRVEIFEDAYELVALLQGAGSTLDPRRNAGSFNVRIELDSTERARFFSKWLNEVKPNADRAIDPKVITERLAGSALVATALRQYAAAKFPVPNVANNSSHEKLLRRAISLAPDDAENTLALARYFRAVGLDVDADAQLAGIVAKLENKADARSRRQLGDAYMTRMAAALATGGGVNPAASQNALAFADRAVRAYSLAQRPDLVSSAQFARGRLLRGLRTRASLEAASKAFREALAGAPDIMRADDVVQSNDGKSIRGIKWTATYALSPVARAPEVGDPRLRDRRPLAWDARKQRLLVIADSGLEWQSLKFDSPEVAPAISLGQMLVANGAILRIKDRNADYVSQNQVMTAVPVGGTNVTTCPPVSIGTPISDASISPDGNSIAIICSGTLRVFYRDISSFTQILEKKVGGSATNVLTAAGPALCGTVLISYSPFARPPVTTFTLARGASEFVLDQLPFDRATSDMITFVEDRVLIGAQNMVRAFRCADGKLDDVIKLSPRASPSADLARPNAIVMRWITARDLAVTRFNSRSVDVITWPTKTVRHFSFSAALSALDLGAAAYMPMPAETPDDPPRALRLIRSAEVRAWPDPGQNAPTNAEFPGIEPAVLTDDGQHLLVQRLGAPIWVAGTASDERGSEGMPRDMALDTLPSGAGWLAAELTSRGMVEGVNIVTPDGRRVAMPLPVPPQPLLDDTLAVLKQFSASIRGSPAVELPGFFPSSGLSNVIDDPTLLSPAYMTQQGPIGAPGRIPSLSAAQGAATSALCLTIRGKVSTNAEPLPFPPQLQLADAMYMLDQSPTGISWKAVPPPPASLLPNPSQKSFCGSLDIVRGTIPVVTSMTYPTSGARLLMWTPGGWLATDIKVAPSGGWAVADGSLLLLLPDQAPPGKFTLVRLKSNGTSAPACGQCTALPLLDAFSNVFPPNDGKALNIKESFARQKWAVGMLLVDATGQFVARPDENEMVVISLSEGKVVRRAPLGRPLVLTEHVLALGQGDSRVAFYEY